MTDHAIYKGEQLEIGTKGNGSCKYTGNSQITPAWVLRNNEATYSLSAGISAGIYTCFCAGPAHKSLRDHINHNSPFQNHFTRWKHVSDILEWWFRHSAQKIMGVEILFGDWYGQHVPSRPLQLPIQRQVGGGETQIGREWRSFLQRIISMECLHISRQWSVLKCEDTPFHKHDIRFASCHMKLVGFQFFTNFRWHTQY